jgi:hypothetical protein
VFTKGTLGGEPRHCPPRLEAFSQLLPIDWRTHPVPAGTAVRGKGPMNRQKSLGVARRFAATPPSFTFSRGLVSILGAVIESLMLPVFDSREKLGVVFQMWT